MRKYTIIDYYKRSLGNYSKKGSVEKFRQKIINSGRSK